MMNTERMASGRGSEENNESVVRKICMPAWGMQRKAIGCEAVEYFTLEDFMRSQIEIEIEIEIGKVVQIHEIVYAWLGMHYSDLAFLNLVILNLSREHVGSYQTYHQ